MNLYHRTVLNPRTPARAFILSGDLGCVIYLGFDPVFRDITVLLKDGVGGLARGLPPVGVHHPYATVSERAGGNGVNVFRTLRSLGVECELVIACDDSFENLLRTEGLGAIRFADVPGNSTVILSFRDGETQINAAGMELGQSLWTRDVHSYWTESSINVSTNWWLNPVAPEWVASQILGSTGMSYSELLTLRDPVEYVLSQEVRFKQVFVTDPGMIHEHKDSEVLVKLLDRVLCDPRAILVGNEHEVPTILPRLSDPHLVVIHRADSVTLLRNGEEDVVGVDPLPMGARNFVGAGDAFLAGFIHEFLSHSTDPLRAIHRANAVARAHILGKTPPTT